MVNASKTLKWGFLTLFFLLAPVSSSQEHMILEDFEDYKLGQMNFSGWYTTSAKGNPEDVYTIAKEENNQFFHADSFDTYAHAYKKKGWTLSYYPILSWKWRVIKHPLGAKPATKPSDSAVSVYVVFRKSWIPLRFQTLKYVWAASGDVNHVKRSDGKHPQVQIIIRSGDAQLGEWVREEINIEEDYKKYFDAKKAKNPIAFGVLTDTDSVKKQAIGDYDDFIALKKPHVEKEATPRMKMRPKAKDKTPEQPIVDIPQ